MTERIEKLLYKELTHVVIGLVEGKLMVEIKSCAQVGEIERRQVYNYLQSTNIKLALLLHFGSKPFHYRYISTNKQFNSQS